MGGKPERIMLVTGGGVGIGFRAAKGLQSACLKRGACVPHLASTAGADTPMVSEA